MNVQTAPTLQNYVCHALHVEWCILVYEGKLSKVPIKLSIMADQLNIEMTFFEFYNCNCIN